MEIQEMLLHKCKLVLNLNAVCLENHVPWSYEVLKVVNGVRGVGAPQGGIFMKNNRCRVFLSRKIPPPPPPLLLLLLGKTVSEGIGATPACTVRSALFVYPTLPLFVHAAWCR